MRMIPSRPLCCWWTTHKRPPVLPRATMRQPWPSQHKSQDKNPQEEDLLNLVYCMRSPQDMTAGSLFSSISESLGVFSSTLLQLLANPMPRLLSSLAFLGPSSSCPYPLNIPYHLRSATWTMGCTWRSELDVLTVGQSWRMPFNSFNWLHVSHDFEQGMQRLSLSCHFGRFIQPTRVYRLPLQLMFWLRASVVWWIEESGLSYAWGKDLVQRIMHWLDPMLWHSLFWNFSCTVAEVITECWQLNNSTSATDETVHNLQNIVLQGHAP